MSNNGVIGGPPLVSGPPIPPIGGIGMGSPTVGASAPDDADYILGTLDFRLPNGITLPAPIVFNDTGVAPTNTGYLWGDASASPTVLRFFDPTTSNWLQFTGSGGTVILNGSGPPTGGSSGNYYIDVGGGATNGQFWQNQSSTWVLLTTIEGAPGASITPQGAWNSGTTYHANDVVTYGGVPYISQTTNTNSQPSTNPTDWMLLFTIAVFGVAGVTSAEGLVPAPGTDATLNQVLYDSGWRTFVDWNAFHNFV